MTYSIVARDAGTGALGVAVQSKVLAAGAGLAWVEAGVGAVATQAYIRRAYGPEVLGLLRSGARAADVLARLTDADDLRAERQIGVVTAAGDSAAFTGADCIPWAGHRLGPGIAAQGNIVAGPAVVDDLFEAASSGEGPFAERLVRALAAAEAAGGDRRGRQAAALLVIPTSGDDGDGRVDLRVDDDPEPIVRLGRLLAHHRLLSERPDPSALQPITAETSGELRALLTALGFVPGRIEDFAIREMMDTETLAAWDAAPIGEPRPLPDGWDPAWQEALMAWMVLENLQSRLAADGWIDPAVVAQLRTQARR